MDEDKQKTVVIERVFDAPVERVWQAWSDPELAKKWWGPKGFSAPTVQTDFREGGTYLYSMNSPDFENGKEIFSTGTYKEIVPYERIVCTDSFADENGNIVSASYYGMNDDFPEEVIATITFENMDGKTKQTLRHEGIPADTADDVEEGWNESFDKMADTLKQS